RRQDADRVSLRVARLPPCRRIGDVSRPSGDASSRNGAAQHDGAPPWPRDPFVARARRLHGGEPRPLREHRGDVAPRKAAVMMPSFLRIAAWPLVVKVPVMVAGLMVTVAFTISQVVLWRVARDQESHLSGVTSAYLDGLSGAILPAVIRRDVWEVFDA